MRTKLFYVLSVLVMVALMFASSCSKGDDATPEPKPQSYTLTFDANGGEGAMEKLSADEGKSITLTANSFTSDDYSFSGWNTKADGTGTSYADKAKISLSANLTLYAQWIANSTAISVTGVTLDKAAVTLEPTDFFDPLVATITPADATNKNIVWSSSDENVVCVDESNGAIMTGDEGSATITATTEDGGLIATCEVTVKAPFSFADDAVILIDGVMAHYDSWILNINQSEELFIGNSNTGQPYNYTKTKWSSSNPSVVTLSKSMYGAGIKALNKGTATITAEDSKGNKLTLVINVALADKINFELPGGDKFNMIYVEGGSFVMGATVEQVDAKSDEFPAHNVTLSDFYIAEFEVTQRLWTAVMGTTLVDQRKFASEDIGSKGDLYPMYFINSEECDEFAVRLNNLLKDELPEGFSFSLPSEAQWEYAARGGKKAKNTLFAGGDDLLKVAWCEENSNSSTHLVGTKLPNELGIYDMTGNVEEWCLDWYSEDYYSISPSNNPVSLNSDFYARAVRGGCMFEDAFYCRVAKRGFSPDTNRNSSEGMRIALVQVQ